MVPLETTIDVLLIYYCVNIYPPFSKGYKYGMKCVVYSIQSLPEVWCQIISFPDYKVRYMYTKESEGSWCAGTDAVTCPLNFFHAFFIYMYMTESKSAVKIYRQRLLTSKMRGMSLIKLKFLLPWLENCICS